MSKIILITGASRGFGRIWVEAFLKRGDKVIATARNTDSLNDLAAEYADSLLTLELDVTNRAQCFDVVNKAQQHFGKLDVVINNAGYGLFGAVEEASEEHVHTQFETNVYGLLWVTQAAIPIMRNQGFGHIIQVSSVLGVVSIPLLGLYNASKWAIEAITEAMAIEIKGFGIKTTLIEPIGYSTDFAGSSSVRSQAIDAYDDFKAAAYERMQKMPFGNPDATAAAILKIVDAENPPLRIFFGKTALPMVKEVYANRLAQWEQVSDISDAAHG
jgi:NADP-dependent 3-hydroxy acid dehydrogenase YdfG